jgi:hypothetical protein
MVGSLMALWALAIAASAIGLAGLSVAVWQSAKPSTSYTEVSARTATFQDAVVTGNLTGPTITSLHNDIQTCTCGTSFSSSGITAVQSGTCVVTLRVYNSTGVYLSSAGTTYQFIDISVANQLKYRCINITAVPGTVLSTGRSSISDSFAPTVNQFSPSISSLVPANALSYFMLKQPAFTISPNFTMDRAITLDYGYVSYLGSSFIQATGTHIMFGNGVLPSGNVVLQMVFNGAFVCPSYIFPTI